MQLEKVVPWGRSLHEYKAMFALTAIDLEKSILGCSDGPASFNSELTQVGGRVVSVDPIYAFDTQNIQTRIHAVYPHIMSEVKKKKHDYIWKGIANVEALGAIRMAAMQIFLADYAAGKKAGRYIPASLPILPFAQDEFDLALCSHYLFLYSQHVGELAHIHAILELCRVAQEVRVYPLLSLDGLLSKHLDVVIASLEEKGLMVSLQAVPYQFQRGASTMLVVKRA